MAKIMKWDFEIYVNGELDYSNKLTADQIQKIIDFAEKIKKSTY